MIGIDISKARFDCAVFVEGGCRNTTLADNHQGLKALFKWLAALDETPDRVFCMEATGVYGRCSGAVFASVRRKSDCR